MLKDLTKNLRPSATTQRFNNNQTGLNANESLTRKIQRDIAQVERTISNDGGLINTTDDH